MKKLAFLLTGIIMAAGMVGMTACGNGAGNEPPEGAYDRETLKAEFLADANSVTVTDTSVTFKDANNDTVTVAKNPNKVYNLYASFTTLWYEAGGTVSGCLGGDSAVELYEEYIGRDITGDSGVTIVSTSSAGKNWSTEAIIAAQPDLIICSTAMSGYSTISGPAAAANIPVIAVNYDSFNDYLKWFKVFCNVGGNAELWDSIAMKALDDVVDVLMEVPLENNPTFLSIFPSSSSTPVNTSNTVVGAMAKQLRAKNIADSWYTANGGAERIDINLELVYAAQPYYILVQCHEGEDACKETINTASKFGGNAIWAELNAVKENRICYLQKTLFHNKPNHKYAEAYQVLAQTLYPEVNFSFNAA